MIKEILGFAIGEVGRLKVHDSIANQDTLKVYGGVCICVELVDLHSQVGDVLTGVRLARNPQLIPTVLRVLFKEVQDSIEAVLAGIRVVVQVVRIHIIGEPDSRWRFQKQ